MWYRCLLSLDNLNLGCFPNFSLRFFRLISTSIALITITTCFCSIAGAIGPYVDNEAMVIDQATGLEWQKADDGTIRNWQEALAYCEGLSLAGYSDWRLPNIRELTSIVDDSKYNPAINLVFQGRSSSYWSATTGAYTSGQAWSVYFYDGHDGLSMKAKGYYVRCVRAGFSEDKKTP